MYKIYFNSLHDKLTWTSGVVVVPTAPWWHCSHPGSHGKRACGCTAGAHNGHDGGSSRPGHTPAAPGTYSTAQGARTGTAAYAGVCGHLKRARDADNQKYQRNKVNSDWEKQNGTLAPQMNNFTYKFLSTPMSMNEHDNKQWTSYWLTKRVKAL